MGIMYVFQTWILDVNLQITLIYTEMWNVYRSNLQKADAITIATAIRELKKINYCIFT
ncbi:MAG: hypothetical protein WCD89_07520 [Anaerocolumna sp.]